MSLDLGGLSNCSLEHTGQIELYNFISYRTLELLGALGLWNVGTFGTLGTLDVFNVSGNLEKWSFRKS